MANIWDVAKKAGVSKSTVSRVITSSGPVKYTTRELVEHAMKELDYTPNFFAQGMKNGKTKTIAFVNSDSTNVFFNEMIAGIEDVAVDNDYMLLVCNTNRSPKRELQYIEQLLKRQIDGIIFSTYYLSNVKYLHNLSKTLPMVFVDNIFPNEDDVSTVISEGTKANQKIVEYLYGKGCRRIAYLKLHCLDVLNHRYQGYLNGLEKCGLEFNERLVYKAEYGESVKTFAHTGSKGMEQLMRQTSPPDALMASIDMLAIGAMQYLQGVGILVPEQVKVVGYDDIELAQLVKPTLSTISQPTRLLGLEAARVLLHKITVDNSYNKQIVFDPDFIIRQST